MELMKVVFFKIVAPIIWLAFFAYVFSGCLIQLAKAWKTKNFKKIWLYIWILLVALYFLILGIK